MIAMLCACFHATAAQNPQEILEQATAKMQADWVAAPDFAFVQRDVTTAKGVTTSKTHQVFLIEGSDYYMPIAIGDQSLSENQQREQLQRLRQEVERRKCETSEQAAKRSEQYLRIRDQNGVLLREFTQAFDFTTAGEETVNGHLTYVFAARPRAGYRPPNRTAKILTGMKGRLWVDKETYHWVKADAEAIKPVSVFGIFARVMPGTRMELEMAPVTDSVWLVSRLVLDLKLSVFWHKSSRTTETTFREYRPAADALRQAIAAPD